MKRTVLILLQLMIVGVCWAQDQSLGDLSPTKDPSGKWGYKRFGEWVINPRFDSAGPFSDGLAAGKTVVVLAPISMNKLESS